MAPGRLRDTLSESRPDRPRSFATSFNESALSETEGIPFSFASFLFHEPIYGGVGRGGKPDSRATGPTQSFWHGQKNRFSRGTNQVTKERGLKQQSEGEGIEDGGSDFSREVRLRYHSMCALFIFRCGGQELLKRLSGERSAPNWPASGICNIINFMYRRLRTLSVEARNTCDTVQSLYIAAVELEDTTSLPPYVYENDKLVKPRGVFPRIRELEVDHMCHLCSESCSTLKDLVSPWHSGRESFAIESSTRITRPFPSDLLDNLLSARFLGH